MSEHLKELTEALKYLDSCEWDQDQEAFLMDDAQKNASVSAYVKVVSDLLGKLFDELRYEYVEIGPKNMRIVKECLQALLDYAKEED